MPDVNDVPRTEDGAVDWPAVEEEIGHHVDFCTSYERVQAELQAKAPEYQGRAQRLRFLQGVAVGKPNREQRRSRTTTKKA